MDTLGMFFVSKSLRTKILLSRIESECSFWFGCSFVMMINLIVEIHRLLYVQHNL